MILGVGWIGSLLDGDDGAPTGSVMSREPGTTTTRSKSAAEPVEKDSSEPPSASSQSERNTNAGGCPPHVPVVAAAEWFAGSSWRGIISSRL